jgi:hypothetical protein
MSFKNGKWVKTLLWHGVVTEEECTQHSTENRRLTIIPSQELIPYENRERLARQGLAVASRVRDKTAPVRYGSPEYRRIVNEEWEETIRRSKTYWWED